MTEFTDNAIPYFAWDRSLTVAQIRQQLAEGSVKERQTTAAWVMREAAFDDVWQFLEPAQVAGMMPAVLQHLGRRRAFWTYIIGMWRELGRL